eukprot:SAG11_NODE_1216_length_5501_cov_2.800629_8_plen_420_part_00
MLDECKVRFEQENVTVQELTHPGYFRARPDPVTGMLMARSKTESSKWIPTELTAEYISNLHNAKILLTDSSKVHYSLQKYTEALVAGVLLIGDIPHDRMNTWREFMVEVPSEADNKLLADTALWWLEHEDERLEKTRAGQAWALQNLMANNFFYEFSRVYSQVIQEGGFVGKVFPFPFYVRCRSYGGERFCDGEKRVRPKRPHYISTTSANIDAMTLAHPSHGGAVPVLDSNSNSKTATPRYYGNAPAYHSSFKPLRWLLLHDATRSMGMGWLFDALLEHGNGSRSSPYVESVTVWGPGYPGFDAAESIQNCIAKQFPPQNDEDIFFDVIVHPLMPDSLAAKPQLDSLRQLSLQSASVTVAAPSDDSHSCRTGVCSQSLLWHRPRIVLFSSAVELLEYASTPEERLLDEETLVRSRTAC